jgi:hypothetical protein
VKVIVSKTRRTQPAGSRAEQRPEFVFHWAEGGTSIRSSGKVKISQVAAALQHVLDRLDVDVRTGVTIKAVAHIWARSGGIRRRTVAEWRGGDREALSSFVKRAYRAADELPPPTANVRVDAWIDESDL